ncbi:MAG: alpha/beta fold hydrolase [Alphaproteobacteria bacterium]|nr:alpha/beta fold hydrolase [Alphaproteobacteria bacterium]
MRSQKASFPGALGAALDGRLELPDGPPAAAALFAHCFTCSKDVLAARRIAEGLAAAGFAVLRFDFTGLGHSGGEFANTTFSSNVDDLVAAAGWLRGAHGAPALLVGHSLGGAAVLAAAHRIPEVRAVATIGAPAEPAHVAHLLAGAVDAIRADGEAEVTLGGRAFRIKRQFLDDIAGQRLAERIAALRRALLIFHAPTDETVGIENAAAIYAAAKHPKSFVSLDGADHMLTRREDAAYVASVLAAWASRYVGGTAQEGEALAAAAGEVVVRETRRGRYQQEVLAGGHRLVADEPESVGGDGSGPGPYDLLLAGLGACTSMTLRMYAERKGLPLDRVTVRLAHDRIHAKDCADCETKEGLVDRIRRAIAVEGALSPEQRQRLHEIADKCPVHRTLENEIRIETSLA